MINKALLFGALGVCLPALASVAALAQSTDYVYVETNLNAGNSVRAFARAGNGQLHEIPGSPFATGGSGSTYTGIAPGPEDSDQEIITNPDHSLLFAINAGSDSIAVLRIGRNGALTPVPGSPFPSGGNDPVSLDIAGNVLFVANKAGDPNRPTAVLPNYTTLRIQNDGSLVPTGSTINDTTRLFNSTVSVGVGSSPEQIHVIPGTNLIFADDLLSGILERFQFDWAGGLHQLSTITLPPALFNDTVTPRLLEGIWNHPTLPLLYVGIVEANQLAVYRYDRFGDLRFLRAVPNQGQGICWIRTNSTGTRLYTTDTATNSVGVYDITDPETPVELQEFSLTGAGYAFQLGLSADDRNIYVFSPRIGSFLPPGEGNLLHSLTIAADGRLSETLAPIAFPSPANVRPRGVAVVSVR